MSPCFTDAELDAVAAGTPPLPAQQHHLLSCDACRARLLRAFQAVTAQPEAAPLTAPPARAPTDESEATEADPFDVPVSAGRYEPHLGADGQPTILGRGGYGKVLLVKDLAVGRDVALKRLSSRVTAQGQRPRAEARLLREARVIGQLDHPAVVPLHDVGRTRAGQLFYTMRRVRGRTLAEAVATAASFAERLRLLPHVLATCHAVAYAHGRGILHRDLKPQNVMVDRFGETYVIDWGLAASREGSPDVATPDSSGALALIGDGETLSDGRGRLGTPAYMSPEQRTGVRALIDERSDVWGLGGILYQVLTGAAPREQGALDAPPRPVRALEPTCPADLAALCEKALATSREDRYASAEALANDLDAWLHGRQVTAHSYRASELLRRFVKEQRAPLAVGAIGLLLLLSLGVASFLRLRDERNRARTFGLVMLEEALPRLRHQADTTFLTRFTGLAQRWLEDVGTGDDDAAVARAWRSLARTASHGRNYAQAHAWAERCLAVAASVRAESARYALEVNCGAVHIDSRPESSDAEERLAALRALAQRPLPPGAENELELLQARFSVTSTLLYYVNRQGLDEERLASSEVLRVAERWLALEPASADARNALSYAAAAASVTASNQRDLPRALALSARATALAREALGRRRDEASLQSYANALVTEYDQRRWYAADDAEALARLAREAHRALDALVLLLPGASSRRLALAGFLVEAGELAGADALLRELAWTDVLPEDREAWVLSLVAVGQGGRLLEHAPALLAAQSLDLPMALALARLEAGDLGGALEATRAALTQDTASHWQLHALKSWALKLPGAAGAAAQRFEAATSQALVAGDDDAARQALTELAQTLERLAGP